MISHRINSISTELLSRQSKSDDFAAFLAGRVVKLAANAMRPVFYLHYWLLPHQRFQLANSTAKPAGSAKIMNNNRRPSARLVPKIIWQTNYTNRVSLPIKTAWCWNRLLSRSYNYRFHSTAERLAFVKQNFPGKPTELYSRLTIGAAQADVWRLMVLYKHGGVYMDIDSHFVWPLDRFIEAGTSEIFLRYKSKDATNYFIASAPANPNIKALLDEVLYRIENSQSNNVYDITGPSVFQDVLANKSHTWRLAQHTCLQGNFSNKFFQYLDKPQGCWTQEQKLRRVVHH
jgi:mannosyltransferase OCH1-like enzyme